MSISANQRGIIAIVVATGCFTGNDAVVKAMTKTAPLGEVLFVRGIMTTVLVGTLLLALGHGPSLRFVRHPVVLVRSGMEAAAALLFTTALMHMPLASLSSTVLLSPLIITALAVVIYGEVVGWRRWTAIIVGFAGTLFIIRPTPSTFDAWALLGVACACTSAGRDLLTRRLPLGIPSIIVSFMAAVSVTLTGAVLGFWESWRALQPAEIGVLTLGAAFLAAGNFLVVLAYREVEVSTIAPFRYTLLVWSGLTGYLVFGEVPDQWAAVGAALIVGSGIYAMHRERIRARAIATGVPPS